MQYVFNILYKYIDRNDVERIVFACAFGAQMPYQTAPHCAVLLWK